MHAITQSLLGVVWAIARLFARLFPTPTHGIVDLLSRRASNASDILDLGRGVALYTGAAASRRLSLLSALGLPSMAGGAGNQSLFEKVKATLSLSPQLIDNATVNGNSVDMLGYDFVDFIVLLGATDTGGTVDAVLEDSADNSSFADVSGYAITQLADTDDNKLAILSVAHREGGLRRYVRLPLTVGNATTGANCAAIAVQYGESGGAPSRTPVTQASTTKELKKV